MSRRDTFDRLLASLHEAALDDTLWPATSALLDEAFGAAGNELVVAEGPPGESRIVFAGLYYRGQHHEELEREYLENYYLRDERRPRIRSLPDGRLVHVTDLYTDRELKTSPTYNEILPLSNARNSLNLRLDGLGDSIALWMIADPVASKGWGSGQLKMIERLVPHLRQFLRVRQALAGAEALRASLPGLLDNVTIGVIHLDRQGKCTAANDRARGILRQGDGLFDRGGVLRARLPADDARLQRLLAAALPGYRGEAAAGSMSVRRSPHLPRLAVHVTPVAGGQMDITAHRVGALVLVVDPANRPRIDPDLVARTLGLTPSQSRVAVALAEGHTVRDIAVATRRKESSVRSLIRQVYDRQGISRQADLVRLVLSLAGLPRFRS